MAQEELRTKMNQALSAFSEDLSSLRVGQATPALIEKFMIEAYDTKMPLVELATITTSGPNQLLVTPFDQSVLKNIEKALSMDRDLGLTVKSQENNVHVQLPPLTEERRQEFIKLLKQKIEAARIMIRQVRHEQMEEVKRNFDAKQINEDEKFNQEKEVQEVTDDFNKKIEELGRQKEKELSTI